LIVAAHDSFANLGDTPLTLDQRTFGVSDQAAFASVSGDRNPMHMDATVARRTQAGARVVHGVHLFLWALESLAARDINVRRFAKARVRFMSFVYVDQPASIEAVHVKNGIRLSVFADGSACASVTLITGDRSSREAGPIFPVVELGADPLETEFERMGEMRGCIAKPVGAAVVADRMFPILSNQIGAEAVCEIALLSSLVGMVVPGLHSIFSEFVLSFHQSSGPSLGLPFEIVRADARFRSITVATEAAFTSASVTAFARFPPQKPARISMIVPRLNPGEFANRRALIVGGSRGIGAATAKLIAAGGGSVVVTYADGHAEAEAVRSDIVHHRQDDGACKAVQYRSGIDDPGELAGLGPFTHVYYFVTPRIFGGSKSACYDRRKFKHFAEAYITNKSII